MCVHVCVCVCVCAHTLGAGAVCRNRFRYGLTDRTWTRRWGKHNYHGNWREKQRKAEQH